MSVQLAVDFGTTNTVVTVVEAGNVRILNLPELGRLLRLSPIVPYSYRVHVSEEVMRQWLFFPKTRSTGPDRPASPEPELRKPLRSVWHLCPKLQTASWWAVARPCPAVPTLRHGKSPVLFLQALLVAVRKQGYHPYRPDHSHPSATMNLTVRNHRCSTYIQFDIHGCDSTFDLPFHQMYIPYRL